jgi:hypothetical protein
LVVVESVIVTGTFATAGLNVTVTTEEVVPVVVVPAVAADRVRDAVAAVMVNVALVPVQAA